VFASGSGRNTIYRLTTEEEVGKIRRTNDGADVEALVWSIVFREDPLTAERVADLTALPEAEVQAALDSLVAEGRIERVESGGRSEYRCRELVLGLEDPAGWEASVLDHYSAMVRTIGKKLSLDQRASAADEVGGSTYHYTLYRGHPMQEEVLGELRRFRERSTALRARLDQHNKDHGLPANTLQVTAYFGQCAVENEDEDDK
jgi:hypothetical protein